MTDPDLIHPDPQYEPLPPTSLKIEPILEKQADAILSDPALRKSCEESGVDLKDLVHNLSLTVPERIARNRRGAQMAYRFHHSKRV